MKTTTTTVNTLNREDRDQRIFRACIEKQIPTHDVADLTGLSVRRVQEIVRRETREMPVDAPRQ